MKCSHNDMSKELGSQIVKIDAGFIKLQGFLSRFDQFEETLFETKKMSLNNSLILQKLELNNSLSKSKYTQRYSYSSVKHEKSNCDYLVYNRLSYIVF